MPNRIPKFTGFADPVTNFTILPNEFFDKVLVALQPAEVKVLLFIFRKTWGWQKIFDQIAVSQFTKQLGLSKNTVLKVLASLEKCGCILHFRTGKGSNQKTYFFINSATSRQVVQGLKEGFITIEQMESTNRFYPHGGAKNEPSVEKPNGAEKVPSNGAQSEPSGGLMQS